MHRLAAILLMPSLLVTAPVFAQSLANIPTAYVPEASYKRLKCEDLAVERARAENEFASLSTQLQTYHSRYLVDFLALGLPLTTMGGDTVAAETYFERNISHVKGELEAISTASRRRNCGKQSLPTLSSKAGQFDERLIRSLPGFFCKNTHPYRGFAGHFSECIVSFERF